MSGTAVIFHNMSHLSAALAVAAETGKQITLLTPVGGAGYADPGYYQRLLERAVSANPGVRCRCLLDCGADAALALQALRDGWMEIVFAGPAETREKIESAAGSMAPRVLAAAPAAIDLMASADIDAACRQALTGDQV